MMEQLSKGRVIFMGISVASAYMVWGLLISLQPPFYPQEAEKKGASPSQYGFVFGIANLAAFLVAPIFGKYGTKIGPKLLYNGGAYLQGICGLAFGFLTYIDNVDLFIGLSYLLRALGGIADVAAWGAIISILLKLFPDKVSSILSWTEMFFGLGYMLGPALGAFLYEVGGFTLPFVIVGSIGIVVATSLLFVIPNVKVDERKVADKTLTLMDIAKSPAIFLPFLDLLVCFFGNGMIASMLEPHLSEAGADSTQVGFTFLIFGAVFMVSAPLAGFLCDKLPYPSLVSVLGNVILATAFIFLGPLPSINITPSWQSITTSTAFVALGYGAVMVSTFGRAQGAATRQGFSQDIDTYLLISGMWQSSFYFGNFLGPTIAGFLVDAYGFRKASIVFFSLFVAVVFVDLGELAYNVKKRQNKRSNEYHSLE